MKKYSFIIIVDLFSLLMIGIGSLHGASIAVGEASGAAGTQGVLLSVDLTTGADENVAALQFDVNYDADQLTFNEVTTGQVTLDAGKDVTSSTPSTGTIRTIVYGLNQNSIADGTIAIISFDINASASAGEVALSISNAVASDPDADSISLSTVDESITISSGGADDDSEESSEDEDIDEMMEALNGCFINTMEN